MELVSLNPVQKEAVMTTDGPVMILAGAGSGKTRTLVARIVYLLEEMGVGPYRILAVTFSNKAAKEMRERVASEMKMDPGALQITTFHSFCAQVLRKEAVYLGLSRSFTIYDDSESKAVVKSLLANRGISPKEINPYAILYYIDALKNSGHYLGRKDTKGIVVDETDEFWPYYTEYEAELRRSNAVDFGGLITGVLQLFETHPEVLAYYQNRFHYILVDEYQDTNRAQFDLLCLLTGERKNICVVGDEDQSIYSWRGADIRNILDFEKVYPEARTIKLEQNYRSSKVIIDAASRVIARNEMRKGKEMWTSNPEGEIIKVVECPNEKDEAEYVVKQIVSLRQQGVAAKDIALFYRNNSQSRIIEDYLRRSNVPYRIVGGTKFYDRKEIKDLLSYMKLVINPKDSLSFSRIINVPARGIGATTLRKLEDGAVKLGCSLWEMVEQVLSHQETVAELRLSGKARSALTSLAGLINEVKLMNEAKSLPSVCYEKILHESGYLQFLRASRDYESMARAENLEELLNAIKQYEEARENSSLEGFLESVTLDVSLVEEEERAQGGEVVLMTVHSSKGLEFPYVFLVGAEENIFPSFKSLENGKMGEEEERRLFYVAMTRAMKMLTICFCQARMLFGSLKFNGPSRFLDEIPQNLYQWSKVKGETQSGRFEGIDYGNEYSQESFDDHDFGGQKVFVQAKINRSTFPTGSLVIHGLYGEGKVLESEGSGNEEKVIIQFKGGVRKKFMVKYAPIVLV